MPYLLTATPSSPASWVKMDTESVLSGHRWINYLTRNLRTLNKITFAAREVTTTSTNWTTWTASCVPRTTTTPPPPTSPTRATSPSTTSPRCPPCPPCRPTWPPSLTTPSAGTYIVLSPQYDQQTRIQCYYLCSLDGFIALLINETNEVFKYSKWFQLLSPPLLTMIAVQECLG